MSPLLSGLVSGLQFGAIDVGLMLPMSFPDKKTALLGAFSSRFAIGLVIPPIQLPSWPCSVILFCLCHNRSTLSLSLSVRSLATKLGHYPSFTWIARRGFLHSAPREIVYSISHQLHLCS